MTRLTLGQPFHTSTPLLSSAGVSVVVHAVLIGLVRYVGVGPPPAERDLPTNSIARFLAPPNRTAGQRAQREMIRYVALAVPQGTGAGLVGEPMRILEPTRVLSGLDERDQAAMPSLPGVDSVYSIVEVDSAATRYEWSAAPAYPPGMLEQRQGGYVKAQWVVDESGYADTATLAILEATHPDFSRAVRDALPFMRFSPAKIGSRAVRQLVQQEFTFRVTTVADTSTVRRPAP